MDIIRRDRFIVSAELLYKPNSGHDKSVPAEGKWYQALFSVCASCDYDHEPAADRSQSHLESSYVANHRTRTTASSFPLPRIAYAVERIRVRVRKQRCPRMPTVQRSLHSTACGHSAAQDRCPFSRRLYRRAP